MVYILDSNVFIESKNRWYGFDFCPAFWDWLDASNAAGLVFSVEPVRQELLAKADDLAAWVRSRQGLFLPPDAAVVSSLTATSTWAIGHGYTQAALSEFLQRADYHLVAHAHARGFTVVTHETSNQKLTKIKIPNACDGMGVPSVSLYDMLRAENAQFVLP